MFAQLRAMPYLFLRPLQIVRSYRLSDLRPDTIAGLTVAIISLPQAIAYGLVAGLTPQMGLYTAIVGPIVGAFWGSSSQIQTSPTTALSLLVFASLAATRQASPISMVVAAGVLAVMAGVFQIVMGVARLGMLVNFISDSVIVGFAAGAGIQIAAGEFRHLFGLSFTSRSLIGRLQNLVVHLPETHVPTFALGTTTLILMLVLRKYKPKWPATVICLVVASLLLFVLHLDQRGVKVIGALPRTLPPLTALPIFNLDLISELSSGALAVAALGLIQTMATARTLSTQTGERLDNNQEFVGQGVANVACGFLSGYPCGGSISCSAINYEAGAKTPVAAVLSGVFTLAGMLALAPLGAYLPRAALSGVLIVVGFAMINRRQMANIWHSSRGDAAIMLITFLGTLFLRIDFAVLAGILMSLAYYIMKTSAPRVIPVVPDDIFRHFVYRPDKAVCPQLAIMDISGDLYFGAVAHVEEAIRQHRAQHTTQRFLLLRMHSVDYCDISGIRMLESIVKTYRDRGGDVYMVRVRESVLRLMQATGFYERLGADHFLNEDDAVEYLFYRVLDPAICIYESGVRVFRECQNLPRPDYAIKLPLRADLPGAKPSSGHKFPEVSARSLWQQLHSDTPPMVVDVREPREYKKGHIPEAELMPLSTILTKKAEIPHDRLVVLVCQTGRRSTRAAGAFHSNGCQVRILQGGMLAWETAGLLEAVDEAAV